MRILYVLLLSLIFAPLSWAAQPVTADAATIALVAGQTTGAGYVTLHNNGDKPLILTSITSDCCASVNMHEMTMNGDIMRMRAMKKVSIAAHGEAEFVPGENHIMFVKFKTAPKAGEKIHAILHFNDGSSLPVDFTVNLRGYA